MFALPVAQYPDVVPPTVQVTTRYPGAEARTVVDAVALPIEQQVNGVEGMIYMQSFSAADGSYSLTVTFRIGVDLNVAQILVQNRVSSACLAAAGGAGAGRRRAEEFNGDPSDRHPGVARPALRQPLSRQLCDHQAQGRDRPAAGVGNVVVFGAGQYSMRIWLDPNKMQSARAGAARHCPGAPAAELAGHRGQIGAPPRLRGRRSNTRSMSRASSATRRNSPT